MNSVLNFSQRFVVVKDISDNVDTKLLNNSFKDLTFKNNIQNKISLEMDFFNKDYFIDTKHYIEGECKNYLNSYMGLEPFYTDLSITQSWGNITEPGQSHHDHAHPFSVVAGVIFLDNTPDNLNLHIEATQPEIPYFIPRIKSYIALKTILPEIGINPAEHNNLQNHLVLFLGNSHHYVEPTSKDSVPRRTISFNTFWKGLTGVKAELLAQHTF